MIDDEIDPQKPLPWCYPGEVIAHRRHSSQAPKGKVKVRLAQELWLVDGELVLPWLRFRDGSGARGLATPTPVVLEKGIEVEIEWGHTND
jgi:hypothetical protein